MIRLPRILIVPYACCVFAMLSVIATVPTRAQSITGSSDGRDFYIGYFNPFGPGARPKIHALVSSYATDTVRTSYFGQNGQEIGLRSDLVGAHRSIDIPLDPTVLFAASYGGQGFASYRIRSKSDISVQVYSDENNGCELYLALPTTILGKEYVVSSYTNTQPIEKDPEKRSVFQVIATQSNTTVYFHLTAATQPAVPDSVTLSRGEVYFVRAASAFGDDLSGSSIRATKPVVVLAGHEGAALPELYDQPKWLEKLDNVQNMLIEQMRPLVDWDTHDYLSIPFNPNPNYGLLRKDTGDMFRIYALPGHSATASMRIQPNATGSALVSTVALPGTYGYTQIDDIEWGANVEADSAIDVVQHDYYQGRFSAGVTYGATAPVMMNIIPRSHWKTEYLWNVPMSSEYKGGQYLSLIYDVTAPPILRNGNRIIAYDQNAVHKYRLPDHPELQGVTVRAPTGDYYASATKPFIVYSYGRSEGNYKVTAGYAAPCGTLGTASSSADSRLDLDSICGSWIGYYYDLRDPAGSIVCTTDTAIARKLRITASRNIVIASEHLNDTTTQLSITIVDRTKDAVAYLYMQDDDGLHLTKVLQYNAPLVRPLRPIRIERIQSGLDSCFRVIVRNDSKTICNLESLDTLHYGSPFRITAVRPDLPCALAAGDSLLVDLCALTQSVDSTILDTLRMTDGCVDFVYPMSLYAVAPRVNWDAPDSTAALVCGDADTIRVWLSNDNLKDGSEIIYDVRLVGQDATEFSIVGNQLGYTDLHNWPLDPGERVWFDIAFHPDMTKPLPVRWSDRHATLDAPNSIHTPAQVSLTAHLTKPGLTIDQSAIDLGRVLVPAYGTQQLTLTDTGDAPVIVRGLWIGNSKITVTGLNPGDTIWPGQSKTVLITGTSTTPDSIVTELHIDAYEECANPIVLPVVFVPYAPPHSGPHVLVYDDVLPDVYVCTSHLIEEHLWNDGDDTLRVVSISLEGTDAPNFQLDNGSQHKVLDADLLPGGTLRVPISWKLLEAKSYSVILTYTWTNGDTTVVTQQQLTINGLQPVTSLSVGTPLTPDGTTASKTIEVPISLNASLPDALQARRAEVVVRYRRDLFHFIAANSTYALGTPVRTSDGNGNELVTLTLATPTGFDQSELATLALSPVIAKDTSTAIEIMSFELFGEQATDTLCVDYSETPASFEMSDLCGDRTLREYLYGNLPTLRIDDLRIDGDELMLRVHSRTTRTARLRVRDLLGRVVDEQDVTLAAGVRSHTMLAPQASGMYVVTITTPEGTAWKRIVR